jgi:hypothetical protein
MTPANSEVPSELPAREPAYPTTCVTLPILLGQGEPLLEGIDLPALGYSVKEHVSTEAAMH